VSCAMTATANMQLKWHHQLWQVSLAEIIYGVEKALDCGMEKSVKAGPVMTK
jgi:hypothetical protein